MPVLPNSGSRSTKRSPTPLGSYPGLLPPMADGPSTSSPPLKKATAGSVHPSDSPTGANATASDPAAGNTSPAHSTQSSRVRTRRACDNCRSKKTRCIMRDGESTCEQCNFYSADCTFHLPISETRFKRKRDRNRDFNEEYLQERQASQGVPMGYYGAYAPRSSRMLDRGVAAFYGSSPLANGDVARSTWTSGWQLGPPDPMPTTSLPLSQPAPVSPPQSVACGPPQLSGPMGPPPGMLPMQPGLTSSPQNGTYPPPNQATSTLPVVGPMPKEPPYRDLEQLPGPLQSSPSYSPRSHSGINDTNISNGNQGDPEAQEIKPTSILGPTSMAFLLHSSVHVPEQTLESLDWSHQQFDIDANGDGCIKVNRLPRQVQDPEGEESRDSLSMPNMVLSQISSDVMEKLINSYFEVVAPLFPVVTKTEFLKLKAAPPLLVTSILTVAAMQRSVPYVVLSSARTAVNALIRETDAISSNKSETLMTFLLLSVHQDLHGSYALQCSTRCWNRAGLAVRLAQGLGLHRKSNEPLRTQADAAVEHRKRRLWGECIIYDRRISFQLGRPFAIDLDDCDIPSEDDFSTPDESNAFLFRRECFKMTLLAGRVYKAIYGPTGLMKVTDETLYDLVGDFDKWREALPSALKFEQQPNSPQAGMLHIYHAATQIMLQRVFLRVSYVCPPHLTFTVSNARRESLLQWAKECVVIAETNDAALDVLGGVAYSLVIVATMLYHVAIVDRNESAGQWLLRLRSVFQRMCRPETQLQSVRDRSCQIVTLLCDLATRAKQLPEDLQRAPLNPTYGVHSSGRSSNQPSPTYAQPDLGPMVLSAPAQPPRPLPPDSRPRAMTFSQQGTFDPSTWCRTPDGKVVPSSDFVNSYTQFLFAGEQANNQNADQPLSPPGTNQVPLQQPAAYPSQLGSYSSPEQGLDSSVGAPSDQAGKDTTPDSALFSSFASNSAVPNGLIDGIGTDAASFLGPPSSYLSSGSGLGLAPWGQPGLGENATDNGVEINSLLVDGLLEVIDYGRWQQWEAQVKHQFRQSFCLPNSNAPDVAPVQAQVPQ